jgi:hypothetical protein
MAHKRGKIHIAIRPLETVECLQLCPWFTITPLESNQSEQCSPGARGGAAGRIPATSLVALAGEVAGEGLVVAGNRLGCLLMAERQPGVGCGGGRRRQPLGALPHRACSSAWPTSGRGSFAGARGRREEHMSAVKSGRRWSSP